MGGMKEHLADMRQRVTKPHNVISSLGSTVGDKFNIKANAQAFDTSILNYGGTAKSQDVECLSKHTTRMGFINDYVRTVYKNENLFQQITKNLSGGYQPDISGYVLCFMIPPHLSGYIKKQEDPPLDEYADPQEELLDNDPIWKVDVSNLKKSLKQVGSKNQNYEQNEGFTQAFTKSIPFLATSFTPPQVQLDSSSITNASSSQSYASDLSITDNLSISYLETSNLIVYGYHKSWIDYIYEILEGTLKPKPQYITNGIIDYASSFYFVKYRTDLQTITYIGKATGCFPKDLPSAEILGNRGTNEISMLSFNYTVSNYNEMTYPEAGDMETIDGKYHWMIEDLYKVVMSNFNQYVTTDPTQPLFNIGASLGPIDLNYGFGERKELPKKGGKFGNLTGGADLQNIQDDVRDVKLPF